MPKRKKEGDPIEIPEPERVPEIKPDSTPEYPELPEDDPDIIPDEDPFVTPPYEVPEPGEGP